MKNKKLSKKNKVFIVLFILLFSILYSYIYIFPSFSNKFQNAYTLEYGTVVEGEDAEYLVVRNEVLYYAKNQGKIDRKIEDGELVRIDTDVIRVGNQVYQNDTKGIVSYKYDGLENEYTLDNISGLKEEELDKIKKMMKDENGKEKVLLNECKSDQVENGDPIYKIVDNEVWYIVTWLPKSVAATLSEGSSVKVDFGDSVVKMRVYDLYEEGQITEVILSANSFYEGFDEIRIGKAKIITDEVSGLVLETSSIVTIGDGTVGVYIINSKGEKVFRPIEVLLSSGDKTVVSRNYFYDSEGNYTYTVKIYDKVLRKNK